jgi:mannitol/fructose-specific phosphotransferase system IIA component (Ntr-type)
VGILWFRTYGRSRVVRDGAIYHVFERWGRLRYEGLDRELRGIMREKGLREEDPFDEIVARSFVLEAGNEGFGAIVAKASALLSERVSMGARDLEKRFLQGTLIGATPVTRGVALPHLRLEGIEHPEMVLVRSRRGVSIHLESPFGGHDDRTVEAIFFLVSPEGNPGMHLRMLAQIAEHVEHVSFSESWRTAGDENDLKEVLLRDERFLTIHVVRDSKTAVMIGCMLREIEVPEGSLIALVKRGMEIVVPRGSTALQEGDRLTVIGSAAGIRLFQERYGGLPKGVRGPPRDRKRGTG